MKQKIFIIYGGKSNEHEVSISSGTNLFEELQDFFDVNRIFISKNNEWFLNDSISSKEDILSSIKKDEIVIPMIHGEFGEDGKLQELLELKNITFVGSDSSTSKFVIDKIKTQNLLEENGISVPKTVIVSSLGEKIFLDYPLIIKPNCGGSSVDLYKVKDERELNEALKKSLLKYKTMMIQETIVGREITCGVFDDASVTKALLPTEIILTKTELFDYEAKYTVGGCDEITPAKIGEELTKKIQDLSIKCHTILGCKDFSRTDMIIKENGEIVVLEVNTIPGMTKTSFFPAQAKASGYSLSQIFDIVISNHKIS